MKRNNVIVLAVLVVLLGLAVYQNLAGAQKKAAAAGEEAPKVNYAAPAFQLEAMDGKTYQVGGPREKPLVVNFWASWCPPCQEEAPDLQSLYKQFGDKIDFYSVNLAQSDKLQDAKKFVEDNKLTFPILLDKDGAVAEKYKFVFIPSSYLIDKSGTVREVVNILPRDEWVKRLNKLLAR
jgi:peroxiredoxin